MMGILNYYTGPQRFEECVATNTDERFSRDALGDLKHGLDLLFELKREFDKLHPMASETLIRLLSF